MKDCPNLQRILGLCFIIVLGGTLVGTALTTGIAYADPATRLVSTLGMDAGDCTTHFCKSIQFAVNVALPGDTILVFPGIYNENLLITTPDLILRGLGASVTTIKGDATSNVVYAVGITSLTIEGFTVRNAGHISSEKRI